MIHAEAQAKKKNLVNQYKVAQGEIIDYMIDYNDENYKSQKEKEGNIIASNQELSFLDDRLHSDFIGEYKSEYIKIYFDETTSPFQLPTEDFDENREMNKVDLNKLGYRTHILREGAFMEKVFYGCKLIDSKKVFTVRNQYQLVNFTGFDYLVYFKSRDNFFIKYLESGDSIPMSKKFDDCKMQIKMIDDDIIKDYQERLGINMA